MKNNIIKELVEKYINQKQRIDHISQYIKAYHLNFFEEIITNTSYMKNFSVFTERIYHIINDFKDYPKCPVCNQNTKFINFIKGYSKFCSVRCSCKDEEVKRKKEETNLKLYGYKNPTKNIKIQKKSKETKFKKYGNENYINVKKIKEAKKEKYGDENYTNREKAKETWKNKPIIEKKDMTLKKKKTCLKKFWTTAPAQNLQVQKKKMKKTSFERYGVYNYCESKEYKEKTRKHWAKLFF